MTHVDLQLSALMLGQAGELLTGGGGGGDDPFGTGIVDPTESFKSEEQQICEALGGTWPGGSGPCQGVDTIVLQKEKQKRAQQANGGNGATDRTTMLLTVAAAALVVGGLVWIFKR